MLVYALTHSSDEPGPSLWGVFSTLKAAQEYHPFEANEEGYWYIHELEPNEDNTGFTGLFWKLDLGTRTWNRHAVI